jgi:hypothetical protein
MDAPFFVCAHGVLLAGAALAARCEAAADAIAHVVQKSRRTNFGSRTWNEEG